MRKRKSESLPREQSPPRDVSRFEDGPSSTPSPKTHTQPLKRRRSSKNSRPSSASPHMDPLRLPGPFFEQEQSFPTSKTVSRQAIQGIVLDQEQSPSALKRAARRVSEGASRVFSGLPFDHELSTTARSGNENQTLKRRRLLSNEQLAPASPPQIPSQNFRAPFLNNEQSFLALPRFVYPMPTVAPFNNQQQSPIPPQDFYRLPTVHSSNERRPALLSERFIRLNGHKFTIFECTLICALRMFVCHENTVEHLDDDTAAEVLKAYREGFGRRQNSQRVETPDCQGLFDSVFSNRQRGGYQTKIYTNLITHTSKWNQDAHKYWRAWIYYMDDLCRRYKVHDRLDDLVTMVNDQADLQKFQTFYENDQRLYFRPLPVPTPKLSPEEMHYRREMQVLIQKRLQMQEWQMQQAMQMQHLTHPYGAVQVSEQMPMQLPIPVPLPSTPEPRQKPKQKPRQKTPKMSEMAKQMLTPMPLPDHELPISGPPDYGLGYATH